jgi:hypothetical protein
LLLCNLLAVYAFKQKKEPISWQIWRGKKLWKPYSNKKNAGEHQINADTNREHALSKASRRFKVTGVRWSKNKLPTVKQEMRRRTGWRRRGKNYN